MKRALIAISLAAALSLGACATAPLVPVPDQTLALQADTTLDVAYNVAAKLYLAQVPTMDPALKAKVKPMVQKARALVVACDNGQLLGQATTMADQIALASQLIGDIKTALGA